MIDPIWRSRIDETLSCNDNKYIYRIPGAGVVIDNCQIMHNGLKIVKDCYCGPSMTQLIKENKGVHEPQEEYIFQQILPLIRPGSVMVELGSYWAFYSMWFKIMVPDSRCYMMDEDMSYLDTGKVNFALNYLEGTFALGSVNRNTSIRHIMGQNSIARIGILHSDIQHAEVEMLKQGRDLLQFVDYAFISTHSENGHNTVLDIIKEEMRLIANINHADTFSVDGLIVGQNKSLGEAKVNYTNKRAQYNA